MEAPHADRIPAALRARFRLECQLGQGAFGSVYRARDLTLDRTVALKILLPQLTEAPDFRERFAREARLTARIESPRVARIYDFGGSEAGGWPYIVYQLVEGETLQALVGPQGGPPVPVPQAAALLDQILEGLEAIHAAGVLHRDLKPANVMRNSLGEAVVIDLGLGRSPSDVTVTKTGALLGTPAFMAPEQMVGGAPVASWDLYAAALIFFTLASGRNPLVAPTLPLTHQAKCEGPGRGLVERGIPVPPALDALILGALDGDPEARPRSATEFRRSLAEALGGVSSGVPPPRDTRPARAAGEVSGPAQRLEASSLPAPGAAQRGGSRTLAALAAAALVLAAGLGAKALRRGARRAGSTQVPIGAPGLSTAPSPAARLAEFRREVDADPAIARAMAIHQGLPFAEALAAFGEGRKAYLRLVEARGLAGIVAALATPVQADLSAAARLSLVERLLDYTTQPGLGPLFPDGRSTGLAELLGRGLTATPEDSMTGSYDGDRFGRRARYRTALQAGGAHWVPLRTFEGLVDPERPKLGAFTEVVLQNPAGDAFDFPIGPEGLLVTSAYSVEEQERARAAPSEVLLALEPVPGDLELAISLHGWVLSAHLWIEVVGADETLSLVWSPPPLAAGLSSGSYNYRRGFRLRVPPCEVPAGTRKVRLTVRGLQPMGSPKSTVDIEEIYQRTS